MANDGFGSELWKNVQSIKLGKKGEIEAPVRANGRDGIVVGVDQVSKSQASGSEGKPTSTATKRAARWWDRLIRR